MINSKEKFGVRQRCIEASKGIADLFLLDLHYHRAMNFYVYEGDFTFIGILNKDILLKKDLTAEQCQNLTLGELCKNNPAQEAVINWSEEDDLIALVNEAFRNYLLEEVVVVIKHSHHLLGIINRTDFYNEMLTIAPESDEEMLSSGFALL